MDSLSNVNGSERGIELKVKFVFTSCLTIIQAGMLFSVYAKNPTVNMYYLGEHELNVFGSMIYRHEDYEAAVEMIAKGEIKIDPLILKHFPFEKYQGAYKYIEERGDKNMKVIIDL